MLVPRALRAQPENRKYFYEDIFLPFFVPDAHDPGLYRVNRPGATAVFFRMPKPKGAFRVFIIGGSIAQEHMSLPENLGDALKAGLPERRIEVIGCGMPGYDSDREAMVEQEILDYSPDMIVLMSGHNEGIAPGPPVPIWIMRARDRLERQGAFRSLAKAFRSIKPPPEGRKRSSRRAEHEFEKNLRQNIRHAEARGVPVAVCVPPINYRDSPTRMAVRQTDLEALRGWIRFLRGDFRGARGLWEHRLDALRKAGREDLLSAVLFHLGRCAERLGDAGLALRYYAQALDEDSMLMQCSPRRLALIERIAGEEKAPRLDLDGAFRKRALPGLPGLNMFTDGMHWLSAQNCLVSSEMAEDIMANSGLKSLSWDRAGLESFVRGCRRADSRPDSLTTLRYAIAEMNPSSRGAFLSLRSLAYFEAVYERRPEWFNDISRLTAMASHDQANKGQAWGMPRSTAAWKSILLWHLGELRMRQKDYRQALANLEQAMRLDGSLKRVWLSRSLAQFLAGHKKDALRDLDEASKSPDLIEEARVLRQALDLESH